MPDSRSKRKSGRFFPLTLALLLGGPPLALAHHCGPSQPLPEFPRHSCRTHTQTWQPGEAVDSHPGGAGGRGTGTAPGTATGQGSVHCQLEPDGRCHCGPRRGTGRNIPCIPNQQNTQPEPQFVFHYYYFNGINTPYAFDNPEQRGSYLWDRRLIRGNLLDLGPPVGPRQAPRAPGIKVGNERDVFETESYNYSGTVKSRFCDDAAKGRLVPNGMGDAGQYMLADFLCNWDRFRAGGGMAPGDILECLYQAMWNNLSFAAEQPEVAALARAIRAVHERESRQTGQPRQVNFFIVIGHSQGNFFTEGLAYRLKHYEDAAGKAIFEKRLGLMSLASPTSYESLGHSFVENRVKHLTRQDDVIEALQALPGPGKKPWGANLPQLWPWQPDRLARNMQLWDPSHKAGEPFYSPFLATMGLGPPPTLCRQAKEPARSECDGALYTPLMNSHLIDNYLADPPLSVEGMPISDKLVPELGLTAARSPKTKGVLRQARVALRNLKNQLLASYRASP